MNIALNGLFLSEKNTGGGRYLLDLINGISPENCKDSYFALISPKLLKKNIINNPFIKKIDCGLQTNIRPTRLIWENFFLANLVKKHGIDLLHASGFTLPLNLKCKTVITIFDMTFFSMPQVHQKRKVAYFSKMIPLAINKADKIIAISNQTKNDIVSTLKVHEDKIEVIYIGVNDKFKPINDKVIIENTLDKYHLPEKYILFVGTIEPRKNLINLIHAFNKLKTAGIEHKLVIAGKLGWNYKAVFAAISQLAVNNDIIFTDYILDKDMPLIYNGASVFVYPSLYEGFGIPVIEAMACGIPVITSNVSSLPEVAGKAAILVDPNNADEIASSIAKVINNPFLAQKMSLDGIKRAELFSNKNMVNKTIEIYKTVLNS